MTSHRCQPLRSSAGYSLIELLSTVAIFGVLAATALPHVDTRRTDLDSTLRQVIADYRWARSRAITSGVHYRIEWTGERSYELQRMRENEDGTWSAETIAKSVSLPSHLLGIPDTAAHEFNTRGMMISSPTQTFIALYDGAFNYVSRTIAIWPSGQVQQYHG